MVSATYMILLCFIVQISSTAIKEYNAGTIRHEIDKRNTDAQKDCITRLFEVLQSCCPVPLFVPIESQKKCSENSTETKQGLFHTIRSTVHTFITKIFRRGTVSKDPSTSLIGATKCFIECTFVDMKLLGEDKSVDSQQVEKKFLEIIANNSLHANWIEAIPSIVKRCDSETKAMPVQTISMADGKQCATSPGVFMECFRKALILKCPTDQFSQTQGCLKARAELENCNPVDLLRQVTKPAGAVPTPEPQPSPPEAPPAEEAKVAPSRDRNTRPLAIAPNQIDPAYSENH